MSSVSTLEGAFAPCHVSVTVCRYVTIWVLKISYTFISEIVLLIVRELSMVYTLQSCHFEVTDESGACAVSTSVLVRQVSPGPTREVLARVQALAIMVVTSICKSRVDVFYKVPT